MPQFCSWLCVSQALVCALILGSCVSPKTQLNSEETLQDSPLTRLRSPAAIDQDPDKELILRTMIDNDDVWETLSLQFDQLEYTYYIGFEAQQEFDNLLDQVSKNPPPTPVNFDELAYKKGITPRLKAIEALRRTYTDQIKYYIARLDEIITTGAFSKSQIDRIQANLQDMNEYLSHVPLSTRSALSPWAVEMYEVLPKAPYLQGAYKRLLVTHPEELLAWDQKPEVIAHLKYMAQKYSGYRDQEIIDLTKSFTRSMKDDFDSDEGRSPQSVRDRAKPQFAKGRVVLAFEGSTTQNTIRLAAELRRLSIPATFFLRSYNRVPPNDQIQSLKGAHFSVQLGGTTERDFTKLFDEEIADDLKLGKTQLQSLNFASPGWLRSPFGSASPRVRGFARDQDVQVVHSQIYALDWLEADPVGIAKRISRQIALAPSGGLVFLRLDSAHAAEFVTQIESELKASASFGGFARLEEGLQP